MSALIIWDTSSFFGIKIIFGFDKKLDSLQGWEANQKGSIVSKENLVMSWIPEEMCSTSFRMFVCNYGNLFYGEWYRMYKDFERDKILADPNGVAVA